MVQGLCVNCGRSGEMKKVSTALKYGGGYTTKLICKDKKKCVGSKAFEQEQLKQFLRRK